MDPALGRGRMLYGKVIVCQCMGRINYVVQVKGMWCYDACDNLDVLWVGGT
jgi:hypothetical protein